MTDVSKFTDFAYKAVVPIMLSMLLVYVQDISNNQYRMVGLYEGILDRMSKVERKVEIINEWRHSQPFRQPRAIEMPKVALPLDPRRRLHIEGPYPNLHARF